jgi:hypothetical protein
VASSTNPSRWRIGRLSAEASTWRWRKPLADARQPDRPPGSGTHHARARQATCRRPTSWRSRCHGETRRARRRLEFAQTMRPRPRPPPAGTRYLPATLWPESAWSSPNTWSCTDTSASTYRPRRPRPRIARRARLSRTIASTLGTPRTARSEWRPSDRPALARLRPRAADTSRVRASRWRRAFGESHVWADALARSCFESRRGHPSPAARLVSIPRRTTRSQDWHLGRQRHARGLRASARMARVSWRARRR